jgi:DUF2946 family protein
MGGMTFQRRMGLLALTAMLLLVLVPTLGRLMSSLGTSTDGADTRSCAMADMADMASMKHAPAGIDPAPTTPPGGNHPMHECAYCPILNVMIAWVLCIVLVVPRVAAYLFPLRRPSGPRTRFRPCGLGSRGPPIAF